MSVYVHERVCPLSLWCFDQLSCQTSLMIQFDLNISKDAITIQYWGHHGVISNMTLTAWLTWFSGGHGPNKHLPQNGKANALEKYYNPLWFQQQTLGSFVMYECKNVSMCAQQYGFVFFMCLWAFKQHECVSVYVNVCVRVSTSCIIQMAWGYSLSCLQENSSREKHAALSVSLCSSSQKQRVKSERDIHQLPAFFFLKAIPFDIFSFFLHIIIHYLPALSICNDSTRDFGTEWNKDKWVDNWKYKK